jgi:hypothetical protein
VNRSVPNDIIFRLSPRGGPPPETEILFHAQRAQEDGDTWVGLRRDRNANRIHCGISRLYLITSQVQHRKLVLRGIVRDVISTRPKDQRVNDIYHGYEFEAWWRISDVEGLTTEFDGLGLHMTDGKPYDSRWLSRRQSFNYLSPTNTWPSDAQDSTAAMLEEKAGELCDDLVAPILTEKAQFRGFSQPSNVLARPTNGTIHAVDWSGAGASLSLNPKIRYARWDFTNRASKVAVWSNALSRNDILRMIPENRGLWILDFPFGLPAELMRRADVRLNNIDASLAFTRSVNKEAFRDHCNAAWTRVTEAASKHRFTERGVGCGWFAWFVQLFRQTWTGQVELISTLRATNPDISVLPWDSTRESATTIVEGFPSASLRYRGLPFTGYKLSTSAGRERRQAIVSALETLGVPLSSVTKEDAVEDPEGDVIDALVLLLAGRDALATDHVALRAQLDQSGLLGEGWIYR